MILISVACSRVEEPPPPLPRHTIISQKAEDTQLRFLVRMDVVVSLPAEPKDLEALLLHLYGDAMKNRNSKYHKAPTAIGIYGYAGRAQAESGMGQWLAMLVKTPANGEPEIRIDNDRLAAFGRPPEERFGLSEETRRVIWTELVKAQDRASAEASKRYPEPPAGRGYLDAMKKQIEFERSLSKRYEAAKRHKITPEQLRAIGVEGMKNGWPFPKR